jgi:RNA polymerase sigma-70 factor (ECF subfamily)
MSDRKMTEKHFQRIYDSHWSKLYSIAYSYCRDQTTAQDVTEDVFVNLWLTGNSGITDIEDHLLKSMKAKIYDQFDIQSKDNERSLRRYNSRGSLADTQTKLPLSQEFHQIPNTPRTTFSLARFEAYNNKETTEQLPSSGKTLEHHIARLLRRLRLRLNIS